MYYLFYQNHYKYKTVDRKPLCLWTNLKVFEEYKEKTQSLVSKGKAKLP